MIRKLLIAVTLLGLAIVIITPCFQIYRLTGSGLLLLGFGLTALFVRKVWRWLTNDGVQESVTNDSGVRLDAPNHPYSAADTEHESNTARRPGRVVNSMFGR